MSFPGQYSLIWLILGVIRCSFLSYVNFLNSNWTTIAKFPLLAYFDFRSKSDGTVGNLQIVLPEVWRLFS
jgi:hypothetical protein